MTVLLTKLLHKSYIKFFFEASKLKTAKVWGLGFTVSNSIKTKMLLSSQHLRFLTGGNDRKKAKTKFFNSRESIDKKSSMYVKQ